MESELSDQESSTARPSTTTCGTTDTETEASSSSNPPRPVISMLDRLRAPTLADISRSRKTKSNPPPKGKRRCMGTLHSDPKGVSPAQRIKEYSEEPFLISNSRLFCSACREELSLKRSVINNHIQSGKHNNGIEKLKTKELKEKHIADMLIEHNQEEHLRGETLPEQQQVYRVKVVTTFLKAGVPLSKIELFRDLLEENAYRLTDRRNMLDYVPFILKDEEKTIRQEIKGKNVSVIFDGTSRLGEALAVLLRYMDDEFTLQQRLIRVQMLSKSLTGEEIARELLTVLSVTYSIHPNNLLAAMRDRASTNNVAMRTLSVIYPNVVDIGCFSHTIDHVGSKFKTPVLVDFTSSWISLFSHSPKCRLLWKTRTGRSMKSYSSTRWWSKWEVMKQN